LGGETDRNKEQGGGEGQGTGFHGGFARLERDDLAKASPAELFSVSAKARRSIIPGFFATKRHEMTRKKDLRQFGIRALNPSRMVSIASFRASSWQTGLNSLFGLRAAGC